MSIISRNINLSFCQKLNYLWRRGCERFTKFLICGLDVKIIDKLGIGD